LAQVPPFRSGFVTLFSALIATMDSVPVPPPAKVARLETPKHPRRPADWKPFVTELSLAVPADGCWKLPNGDELKAISFEESFKVLEEHFESEPVAWVIGAPGCGKTSLGRVFLRHMIQKGWTAELWLGMSVTEASLQSFWTTHLTGPEGPKVNAMVLVIIDECQAIKVWGTVQDFLVKNSTSKLLLLGTDHPRDTQHECTPHALRECKFWMFGPTVERRAVCAFLRSALDLHGVQRNGLRDRWCNSIFDVCGGNLDMVLTSMRFLIETGDYPTTYNLLEAKPRTVANGGGDWEPAKVELAQRVCAVGATAVAEERTGRQLVRRGFLMPVRIDHVGSGLVKAKSGDYTKLTWATALQRDYAVICQKVSPLPTREVHGAGVRKPLDLLLRLLPMVDVNFLATCDIAGAGAHSATEYHIQAAVLVAASKVCPRGTFLNEWPIGKSRLDFLYMHDEENQWGFEITRNGSDVDGHMKRFEGGLYKEACSDWLLVDFCTNPSSAPAPSKPNLVRISPHWCVGWDAFTVSSSSQTLYVPRNGVPQHVVVDDTSRWQVKPCVEIVEILPGFSEVWVQPLTHNKAANQFDDLCDAFRVEGRFRDMDHLKKGIGKYLERPPTSISVYCKEEGTWQKLPPSAKVVLGSTMETSYGFTVTTTKWFSD